jgi:hypothetical protein
MQQIPFALPERCDFGVMLAAEFLKTIDFALDCHLFPLAPKTLNRPHAVRRRGGGSRGGGDARYKLGFYRV